MGHLEDLTLFSYLEADLDGHEMSAARTHLATCAFCQSRLSAVQTMLAEVEGLPDLPMTRDLSNAVVMGIKAQQLPKAAPKLSPAIRWALVVQTGLALVGLGVAIPLVTEWATASNLPGLSINWQPLVAQFQTLFSFNWSSILMTFQSFIDSNRVSVQLPSLSFVIILPLLIAVTGLWVVGNGVLLRQANRLQRH